MITMAYYLKNRMWCDTYVTRWAKTLDAVQYSTWHSHQNEDIKNDWIILSVSLHDLFIIHSCLRCYACVCNVLSEMYSTVQVIWWIISFAMAHTIINFDIHLHIWCKRHDRLIHRIWAIAILIAIEFVCYIKEYD